MTDAKLALSRKIAKLRPVDDAERAAWWSDMDDTKTGLPTCLSPFWIKQQRTEDREPTNLFDVRVFTRKDEAAVLFKDIEGIFPAFRKMIDAFEAWQLIKPIERVYFIGTELRAGKLVKVGFSRDPESRLRTLQTSHGERLQIFATIEGGKMLEEKYHRRWKPRRREGEWFVIGDCIINEIERIKAAP